MKQPSPPQPGPDATPDRSEAPEISRMRRDYAEHGLRREDLDADPIRQFERWFQEACSAGLLEPNAMSLATSSADGRPTLRTVLLKGFDSRGFVFFTNLESTKARQIAENNRVALLFPWIALERQVSITGSAEKLGSMEVLRYFITRPFGSQLAAWTSPQSRVITSRSILEGKLAEMKRKFSEGKVPVPSFWGGYRVSPHTIEFWQGRTNRLHDRFQYSLEPDGSWSCQRLAP